MHFQKALSIAGKLLIITLSNYWTVLLLLLNDTSWYYFEYINKALVKGEQADMI